MSDTHVIIEGRVSFPHLFRKPMINGEEGSHGAVVFFDRTTAAGKKQAAKLEKVIDAVVTNKFKGKKPPAARLFFRDGDESGRDEWSGVWCVHANNPGRPIVVADDGASVIANEEDCKIYSGCKVRAKIDIWAQDNNYGKRVNAKLLSIQFLGDGEALDAGHVSVEDAISGFGDVTELDDDMSDLE
ncbi:MAG: DUF2815 family protein [Alphaproteobacteria bacterium]|nr:DUF2815 family protein [Alphaproteobacteria bacterium SS10]